MKRGDYLVIFIVILLVSASFFAFAAPASNAQERHAVIIVDGKEYARYKLSANFSKIIEIETQFGYNKLEINSGKVKMLASSCEDKLAVKAGEIEQVHETLICVPNRLLVTIQGDSAVDMVSY